jgi:hypothetical protein
VIIDAEPGPVEPGPDEPKQPGIPEKKWKIILGCLIGVFVLLAAYDLISGGAESSGGTSAAGTTSPALTHPPSASSSAGSPIAATPGAPHRDASPSPAASPAQRSLPVTAIGSFGPEGLSDGDHPDTAPRALEDGAQPWYSSWYLSPEFGNLQTGTGLLLYMGKSVTVSSVQLVLGGQVGATVEVRVGDGVALADLPIVATAADVGGTVQLPTAIRARGMFVLIWFTALPPIGQGKYQASVYNATVDGTAGK